LGKNGFIIKKKIIFCCKTLGGKPPPPPKKKYMMSRHSIRNNLEKNIFCYSAFYIVLVRKHEGKDYFEDPGVDGSIALK